MTKDEMKNKISMALKDPALQQGFEIICKDLAISEHDREHNDYELAEVYKQVKELKEENAELEKELEQAKKVQVVEHFEAYGQCRDSRRIASLETENAELKKQIEEMKCWYKMDYNDKESCKKIPQGIQLLTEYDCGLFVAYCVNRWTGDHWEEHSYGITRWKEIKEK